MCHLSPFILEIRNIDYQYSILNIRSSVCIFKHSHIKVRNFVENFASSPSATANPVKSHPDCMLIISVTSMFLHA